MPTISPDDAQEREIQALVDQVWGLLVDLRLEQKGEILDRLSGLLALEESTFKSLSDKEEQRRCRTLRLTPPSTGGCER